MSPGSASVDIWVSNKWVKIFSGLSPEWQIENILNLSRYEETVTTNEILFWTIFVLVVQQEKKKDSFSFFCQNLAPPRRSGGTYTANRGQWVTIWKQLHRAVHLEGVPPQSSPPGGEIFGFCYQLTKSCVGDFSYLLRRIAAHRLRW